MDPLTLILGIIIGGILVGICVHFIPCSAIGAMAASTGIATGPTMLASGAGMMGLMAAAYNIHNDLSVILLAGAIGSMLMLALTSLVANITYVFGIGVAPASGQSKVDLFTKFPQRDYVSPQTEGHGIPTQSFISGLIGGALGGSGGALVFYSVYNFINIIEVAGIIAVGIYIINGVLPAYTLVGKTEGFTDRKIKTTHKTLISCLIMSTLCAILIYAVSLLPKIIGSQ
ncbi:MAG: tetrahydromethanopterin S-methyltransferase subunit D [Methanosarcinales archaeon]